MSKSILVLAAVLATATSAAVADLYSLNGYTVDVDYWAGAAAGTGISETIVVADWNDTNGPYVSESHAWGYRWDSAEAKCVKDALDAIAAAGAFSYTTAYGGGFVGHLFYDDGDGDTHTTEIPTDYHGWAWLGDSTDGGATWNDNASGIDVEPLADGTIEGLNFNPSTFVDWSNYGSDNLTVPVPEPATISLLLLGIASAAATRRMRKQR